jgi:hypothetical protein
VNANLTPIQAIFGPIFMSISDILLLYYLCGGSFDHIRKQKTWIPWFIVINVILIGSQLIFNGATNAQANFFLFYAVHIIVLFIFTRKCTDLHHSVGIYLVVLSVLADDICLVFFIALTRQFFGVDMIDTGSFGVRLLSYLVLLLIKIGLTILIKQQTQKQTWGVESIFQALIIILPALPYFLLRSYAFFFNLNPLEVPLIIHYVDILCGIVALVNIVINERLTYQIRQNELLRMESLIKKQHDSYLRNLSIFETVGRKYHDLRHILRGFESMSTMQEVQEYARDIEGEIRDYELVCNTGNKTLDIILSDRMRECNSRKIQMHIHADGQGWDSIRDIDIATIFGNALDNSIESVLLNPSVNDRVIDVRCGRINEMLVARFENKYNHPLEVKQTRYLTTKEDKINHGYGLQSIELAVKKYSGEVDIVTDNDNFTLTVIIPIVKQS